MPPQIEFCTKLETLDLSWNPLRLVSEHSGRDDSTLFVGQHRLNVLGLRRHDSEPWSHRDVQAIALMQQHTIWTPGDGGPGIICWVDPGVKCRLDEKTTFINDWVN